MTADDAKATNHAVTRVSTVSLIVCGTCVLPAEHRADGHVHTDTGLVSVLAPEHTQVRIQVWYSVRCARCDDDWFEDLDVTPVSREAARNGGRESYRAHAADQADSGRDRRPKLLKLTSSPRLWAGVENIWTWIGRQSTCSTL